MKELKLSVRATMKPQTPGLGVSSENVMSLQEQKTLPSFDISARITLNRSINSAISKISYVNAGYKGRSIYNASNFYFVLICNF
jgi:hypothetical protein